MVNGNTWPFLNVEQRRYRFRLLNGCNSRTLLLKLDRDGSSVLADWQRRRLSAAAARLTQLLMGPAERADVIVDFTPRAGRHDHHAAEHRPRLAVRRRCPGRRLPAPSDPQTTGAVMQFRVRASRTADASVSPDRLWACRGLTFAGSGGSTAAARLAQRAGFGDREGRGESGRDVPDPDPRGVRRSERGALRPVYRAARDGQRGRHREPARLDGSAVGESGDRHRGLGDPELHRGRASDSHPSDAVPRPQPRTVRSGESRPAARTGAAPEAWETGAKDTLIAYPARSPAWSRSST